MNNSLRESLIGVFRVLAASIVASLVLAPILALVNVLRNFGLPGDMAAVSQTAIYKAPNALAALIDAYNSSMTGYARFGSGIGMIGGAFWAIGRAKSYGPMGRIVTGLAAGFVIGARLVMMVTSDTPLLIIGSIVGACWTGIYLYIVGLPSSFKPMPELRLKHQSLIAPIHS